MEAISTSGLYQTILGSSTKLQKSLAAATVQESSGLVGSTYGDYGGTSRRILNLQSSISQAESFSDQASLAGDRVQAMYSAVGSMADLMTSLRTSISEILSTADTTDLSATLADAKSDLISLMNSKSEGRYLFSGSQTDTAAVDVGAYPASSPVAADTTDSSYYQGDSQVSSVRINENQTISYGVTADNSAFEQALRAIELAIQSSSSDPVDQDGLQAAYDLADDAADSLTVVQENLGNDANRLTDAQNAQQDFITLMSSSLGDIKNVDTAAAAANVSELQTLLKASYSALSVVLQVRLTDYL